MTNQKPGCCSVSNRYPRQTACSQILLHESVEQDANNDIGPKGNFETDATGNQFRRGKISTRLFGRENSIRPSL